MEAIDEEDKLPVEEGKMHIFFGDDSKQANPTRDKMGPLIAVGGFLIDACKVMRLEKALNAVCAEFEFPKNEEFKWSPGRELWMRSNLIEDQRESFFKRILKKAAEFGVSAYLVVEDTNYDTATKAATHEADVTTLLLERIQQSIPLKDSCIIIVDRPSGGRSDEDEFLMNTLEHLQTGTEYVKYDQIALNVLSTPSKLVRCLQLADLITSCSTAFISGEPQYSPPIFKKILKLYEVHWNDCRGGRTVKIHPDLKYLNLYHWLLGDEHKWKGNMGHPYPIRGRPYEVSADKY